VSAFGEAAWCKQEGEAARTPHTYAAPVSEALASPEANQDGREAALLQYLCTPPAAAPRSAAEDDAADAGRGWLCTTWLHDTNARGCAEGEVALAIRDVFLLSRSHVTRCRAAGAPSVLLALPWRWPQCSGDAEQQRASGREACKRARDAFHSPLVGVALMHMLAGTYAPPTSRPALAVLERACAMSPAECAADADTYEFTEHVLVVLHEGAGGANTVSVSLLVTLKASCASSGSNPDSSCSGRVASGDAGDLRALGAQLVACPRNHECASVPWAPAMAYIGMRLAGAAASSTALAVQLACEGSGGPLHRYCCSLAGLCTASAAQQRDVHGDTATRIAPAPLSHLRVPLAPEFASEWEPLARNDLDAAQHMPAFARDVANGGANALAALLERLALHARKHQLDSLQDSMAACLLHSPELLARLKRGLPDRHPRATCVLQGYAVAEAARLARCAKPRMPALQNQPLNRLVQSLVHGTHSLTPLACLPALQLRAAVLQLPACEPQSAHACARHAVAGVQELHRAVKDYSSGARVGALLDERRLLLAAPRAPSECVAHECALNVGLTCFAVGCEGLDRRGVLASSLCALLATSQTCLDDGTQIDHTDQRAATDKLSQAARSASARGERLQVQQQAFVSPLGCNEAAHGSLLDMACAGWPVRCAWLATHADSQSSGAHSAGGPLADMFPMVALAASLWELLGRLMQGVHDLGCACDGWRCGEAVSGVPEGAHAAPADVLLHATLLEILAALHALDEQNEDWHSNVPVDSSRRLLESSFRCATSWTPT
jgi:hypothetical protein